MTANQINAKSAREDERTNKAREKETNRANKANEKQRSAELRETVRHNKHTEANQRISAVTGLVGKIGGAAIGAAANDPTWTNLNPELVELVAKVNFEVPLGSPNLYLQSKLNSPNLSQIGIPGIMAMKYVPTIGSSLSMRLAIDKIYLWLRHFNSGSRNYDAVDYGIFLLAADSMISLTSFIKKVFKLINTFDAGNRYIAKALLRAIGFTNSSISEAIKNYANYKARFTVLLENLNALSIPSVFYIYKRHAYFSENAFLDEPVLRSQIYDISPAGYHKFVADTTTPYEAGSLKYVKFPATLSLDNLLDYLEDTITSFLRIEDLGIMQGDGRKAFGEEAMLKWNIDEYTQGAFEFIHNPEVLAEIQASTTHGVPYEDTLWIWQTNSGDIKQGSFTLSNSGNVPLTPQGPSFTTATNQNASTTYAVSDEMIRHIDGDGYNMIEKYKDGMTPAEAMPLFSFMTSHKYKKATDGSNKYVDTPDVYGTEILCDCSLWVFANATADPNAAFELQKVPFFDGMLLTNPGASGNSFDKDNVYKYGLFTILQSAFYWAPKTFIYYQDTDHSVWRTVHGNICLKDYGLVSRDMLSNIHSTALLSLYNVTGGDVRTV